MNFVLLKCLSYLHSSSPVFQNKKKPKTSLEKFTYLKWHSIHEINRIRNLLWRSAKLSINELRIIWLLAHFCQNNFVRVLLIAYECFKIVDVLMFSYHTVMILPYSIELWHIFRASCSNINSIKHGPKTEFSSFFVFFVPYFDSKISD